MALAVGIKALHPSAVANRPHVVGFDTARTAAHDTLFEIWNGATGSAIKAAVDKDGKLYSAALTAGDLLYAVTGGVSGVKRLDSLAIGAANTVLTSSGSVPQWSTALSLAGTLSAAGLVTASAGLTVASGQTLTLTGATVAGTPTWSSAQAITLSTAAQTNVTSLGTLTGLTVSGTLTLTGATVAGAPTWSSTQSLNTSGLAGTATALATPRTINGTSFNGTANITVTAAADTLTGTTLAPTVRLSAAVQFYGTTSGNAVLVTSGATSYLPLGFVTSSASTSLQAAERIAPRSGVLRNFYVRTTYTQPATGSLVLTLFKNGAAQAVAVTVPAGEVAGVFSDTSNSFSFVAGDLLAIRIVNNASSNSSVVQAWSAVMDEG